MKKYEIKVKDRGVDPKLIRKLLMEMENIKELPKPIPAPTVK